jgi:hypothetical protein
MLGPRKNNFYKKSNPGDMDERKPAFRVFSLPSGVVRFAIMEWASFEIVGGVRKRDQTAPKMEAGTAALQFGSPLGLIFCKSCFFAVLRRGTNVPKMTNLPAEKPIDRPDFHATF